MKNKKIFSFLIIAVSVILYIAGIFVLPNELKVQLTMGSGEANTMNKYFALMIPLAISVYFSIYYLKSDNAKAKCLIGCFLGIGLMILTFIINM